MNVATTGDAGESVTQMVRYPETLMPVARDYAADVMPDFAHMREELLLNYGYNTARAYWSDLQDIYDWAVARDFDPLDLTDRQITQYVALLRRRKYSENTIRRRLVSYRKLAHIYRETHA
jgi:site-specific recombinase XerD